MVFFQGDAALGSIVDVQVDKAEAYDLYGKSEGFVEKPGRRMMPLRQAGPIAPQ